MTGKSGEKAREAEAFFGGIPTGPDVKRLRDRWPELEVGDTITDAEVAEVLCVPVKSHRYKTVTTVWKKRWEEDGKVIGRKNGNSFVVLTDSEKFAVVQGKLRTVVRGIRRVRTIGGLIDQKNLTEGERVGLARDDKMAVAMLLTAQTRSTAELPSMYEEK
jgi:hypothetical protein